ncbi:fused MFS/spermidine synthase [Natrialbaceae archaeon GCM10025810]|uniref:fused MFS/spermidine synthase n=1 Tax=Halovalidus salilacus TaxID=3075124 RepID=UPI00361C0093
MSVRALLPSRPTKPELAVVVSGIVSMGLEILAGRIVAPAFGSGVYTWGGLITVCLAALSLGYWHGGKRAGTASNPLLSALLLGTAVYVAGVVYWHDAVVDATATSLSLEPAYAALPAVVALFGPPTYLLGYISPFAAELSRKRRVGAASGHVYALGTIGSIAGAALTTYVLVPRLGVSRIAAVFGALLFGTALVTAVPSHGSSRANGGEYSPDRSRAARAFGAVRSTLSPSSVRRRVRSALPSSGGVARPRLTAPAVAVVVSGVVSMGLQILAGRMVTPQFGDNIYTWGSVITVFLAALSLGYWRGGKRAATASIGNLAWLLLGTAGYVAVVVALGELILSYSAAIPIPPRFASLPGAIVLFGPPTYLLGLISPYAADLSIKRGVGEASGHVYALGTIGSIVGSGAATYVLVPTLSIVQTGLLFGFLLVGAALVVAAVGDGSSAGPAAGEKSASRSSPSDETASPTTVASVLVAGLLVVAAVGGSVGLDPRGDVVYRTQTPYQELEVVDDGDARTMYLDGARHSAMDLENPERHVFDYTKYFHVPALMQDDPDDVDRVLFIGGGGYTGPKDYERRYDATVDVVEIDPEVTAAAERHFDLEHENDPDLNVHTEDGRQYLEDTDHEYDVIVVDAYKKDQVPFHLTTEEFMDLASDRLTDDGILLANVISAPSGSASDFYRAQYKTMDESFPDVYTFRTSDSGSVQNLEVVATNEETDFTEADLAARTDAFEREVGVDLSEEVDYYMDDPETDDVPVLRDDRAPVDSLLDPATGQRYVIEESESDGDDADDSSAEDDGGTDGSPGLIAPPSVVTPAAPDVLVAPVRPRSAPVPDSPG